jgi:hypothetical protein
VWRKKLETGQQLALSQTLYRFMSWCSLDARQAAGSDGAGSAATIPNGGANYQGGLVYGFMVGGKLSRLAL